MNATEHLDYLAQRRASAPVGSLRAVMYSNEGVEPTDDAIARGLRAWAVERTSLGLKQHAIVFGRSASDAQRRASAPARLGEPLHSDVTRAAVVASGWEEPLTWPHEPSTRLGVERMRPCEATYCGLPHDELGHHIAAMPYDDEAAERARAEQDERDAASETAEFNDPRERDRRAHAADLREEYGRPEYDEYEREDEDA